MADVSLEQRMERLQQGLREIGRMCLQLGGDGEVAGAVADVTASATAVGKRRLVYVHGICSHTTGFSDPWWDVLHPYVPDAFGPGRLGETRLEVVWSDIVNRPALAMADASSAADDGESFVSRQAQAQLAEEIKEGIRQRIEPLVAISSPAPVGFAASALAADEAEAIEIPGSNCIDDFTIYMVNPRVRQQILNRFIEKVGPELRAGRELDIISHSWGTVVAYEGLRQLADEGVTTRGVRNFFTVGSPLWELAVRLSLRPRNQNGRKPANVRRWVNVSTIGDVIGGRLRGQYQVNLDFYRQPAPGCGPIDFKCAHRSYFQPENVEVNRDIFASYIDQA